MALPRIAADFQAFDLTSVGAVQRSCDGAVEFMDDKM